MVIVNILLCQHTDIQHWNETLVSKSGMSKSCLFLYRKPHENLANKVFYRKYI